MSVDVPTQPLVLKDRFKQGLAAPICLTWELTYACNLACVHCLSSSGRRDPNELTTAEAMGVIDEMAALQVFYVNVGGGEPMVRADFFDLLSYAVGRKVGVKFSTNGTRISAPRAQQLAHGLRRHPDQRRRCRCADQRRSAREGSFAAARRAMDNLAAAGFGSSRSPS